MTASPPSSALLAQLDDAAEAKMRHAIGGAILTQALHAAAKLGIADQLTFGPRSAEELAAPLHADAPTLRRVLRFLVAQGVFLENLDGRFSLSNTAEFLQTAHPRSLRPSAIRAGEGLWRTAGCLVDAVRTGTTPYDTIHGATFFDDVRDRGKANAFASRMGSSTAGLGAAIANHECFAGAHRVVDVGGGSGSLLVPILQRHRHLSGILFDRDIAPGARATIAAAGLNDRCEWIAGDFFVDAAIPAGDVHLLSWILHDWNDHKAGQLLRNCRLAGTAPATLLIVEALLPDHASAIEPHTPGLLADVFTLDLQMLLLTGGRERSMKDYSALLAQAGFELGTSTSLPSERGVSLMTATSRPGFSS